MVTRLYDDALATVGLGASQYAILVMLDRLGPQILRDLAATLVMDRSTVGHLLRPLETRGLLALAVGPHDGRNRVVTLTDAGRQLLREAEPLWSAAQRCFEQQFGANEARTMRSILARVVALDARPTPEPIREIQP